MKKLLSILTIFSMLLSQHSACTYNTEDTAKAVQISEFDYFKNENTFCKIGNKLS